MTGTIDAVNGKIARIEGENDLFFTMPLSFLPSEIGEGDKLDITVKIEGRVSRLEISLDRAETEEARNRITGKLQKLRGLGKSDA